MDNLQPNMDFEPHQESSKSYLTITIAAIAAVVITGLYFFSPLGPSSGQPPEIPEVAGLQGKLDAKGIINKDIKDNKVKGAIIGAGGTQLKAGGFTYGYFENTKNFKEVVDSVNVTKDNTSFIFMTWDPKENKWITTQENIYVGTKSIKEKDLAKQPLNFGGLLTSSATVNVKNFNAGGGPNKNFNTDKLEKGWQIVLAPKTAANDYSFYTTLEPKPSAIWEYNPNATTSKNAFKKVPVTKLDTKISNYIHWVKFSEKPKVQSIQANKDIQNTISTTLTTIDNTITLPKKDNTLSNQNPIVGGIKTVDADPAKLLVKPYVLPDLNTAPGAKSVEMLAIELTNDTGDDVNLTAIEIEGSDGANFKGVENLQVFVDSKNDVITHSKGDFKQFNSDYYEGRYTIRSGERVDVNIGADIAQTSEGGEASLNISALLYTVGTDTTVHVLKDPAKGQTFKIKAPEKKVEKKDDTIGFFDALKFISNIDLPKVEVDRADYSPKGLKLKPGDKDNALGIFNLKSSQNITIKEIEVVNPTIALQDPKLKYFLADFGEAKEVNGNYLFTKDFQLTADQEIPLTFIATIKSDLPSGDTTFTFRINRIKYTFGENQIEGEFKPIVTSFPIRIEVPEKAPEPQAEKKAEEKIDKPVMYSHDLVINTKHGLNDFDATKGDGSTHYYEQDTKSAKISWEKTKAPDKYDMVNISYYACPTKTELATVFQPGHEDPGSLKPAEPAFSTYCKQKPGVNLPIVAGGIPKIDLFWPWKGTQKNDDLILATHTFQLFYYSSSDSSVRSKTTSATARLLTPKAYNDGAQITIK